MLNCPKVNYKLNYKPGKLICPRTKIEVMFDDVKHKVEAYAKMPIKYKREKLKHCQLVDLPDDHVEENEAMAELLKDDIHQMHFLYENTRVLLIEQLQ